jgi:hypothetical protein
MKPAPDRILIQVPMRHTRAARFASQRADYNRLPLAKDEWHGCSIWNAMRPRPGTIGAAVFLTILISGVIFL